MSMPGKRTKTNGEQGPTANEKPIKFPPVIFADTPVSFIFPKTVVIFVW
jgi:hypothetical protein